MFELMVVRVSDYTFHTLSDREFEYFTCDLLNAKLKLGLHAYPSGRDQGVDLQEVRPDGYRIVVQCKHYVRSDRSRLLEAVRKELVKEGYKEADRYILVTSHPMSSRTEADVMEILGIPQEDVWGPQRLNAELGDYPGVERRHFKLWLSSSGVLESMINAGLWNRSSAMLKAAADRAKFWVETPAYGTAHEVLEREGVCVLTGPPGVGKSYLAEIMALRRARDGWQIVDMAKDLDTSWQALKPDDSRQLFVFADPLGEADLAPTAVEDAHGIRTFIDEIARHREDNKRLIVTSPTEVMRRAAFSAGHSLRSLADGVRGRYGLTLDDWDEPTRIRALLNHLHFAGLDPEELRAVELDRRAVSIVRHGSFNPRLIEKICDQFTEATSADEALDRLLDALTLPETVWSVSWAMLGELASQVVLTLATLGPRPVLLSELRKLAAGPGTSAKEWQDVWRSLEPSWIVAGGPATNRYVTLADPSLRDFLLGTLEDSDMAGERLDRAVTLEQLAELSRAAGDLTADVPAAPLVTRPVLAHVLAQRRNEVAERVRELADDELSRASARSALRTLSLAVALLGIYGGPDATTWVVERVADALATETKTQPLEVLALASRICRLPEERARDDLLSMLISEVTANLRSLSDLDAFEGYANALELDLASVAPAACDIIRAELTHLFDEPNPEIIRDGARELKERASIYGHSLEIGALLDWASELEAETQ